MNEFIILAELTLLVVLYVLILQGYSKIYHAYKERQNKPEVEPDKDEFQWKFPNQAAFPTKLKKR